MKKMWRLTSMALVAGIFLTSSLTGCGSSGAGKESTAASQASATASQTSAKSEEPVKLTWYLRGANLKNVDSVTAKANEISKSKINVTVDYKFVDPGSFDQKMQMIAAGGEEYDITFTSNWANDFLGNISKGSFIAIDELLAKYPKLKESIPEKLWNALKVNGKIYGVPNYQILSLPAAYWFKKDLVDKYNIKFDNVKNINDLTEIYQLIKSKEPGIIPVKFGAPEVAFRVEYNYPSTQNFVIDAKEFKPLNHTFEDPGYLKYSKLMREWYQKGFFPQNVATQQDSDEALNKSGKLFSCYTGYKPGVEAELAQKYGFDVVVVPIGNPPFFGQNTAIATVNAISRTSKNPDKAMALLELMNTDKDLYNTMTFGIDGQDYKKVSDNRIEKINNTYQFDAWQLGNQFNAYLLPGQADDAWEQTKKLNDKAPADPLMGFTFNRSSVENEMAQITALYKQYNPIFKNGLDDPDKMVKEFSAKLKTAGVDKVKQEMQKQLDEWKKTTK